MNFRFCMGCYKVQDCYDDGKILCKSRGFVQLPFFCFEFAERNGSSLSPYEKIIWFLNDNGGSMERLTLKALTGISDNMLDPILGELATESKIKITGETISLI
jgi:hypothetical protein